MNTHSKGIVTNSSLYSLCLSYSLLSLFLHGAASALVRIAAARPVFFVLSSAVALRSSTVGVGLLQFVHLAAVVCKRVPETRPGLLGDCDRCPVLASRLQEEISEKQND